MKNATADSPNRQLVPPSELDEQIRKRAYELYELSGRREGFAEQDWLQAEAEILGAGRFRAAA